MFSIGEPPFQSVAVVGKYKVVFTSCVIREEDVLGPMLGAFVWVEVSKCKVSKHCYAPFVGL